MLQWLEAARPRCVVLEVVRVHVQFPEELGCYALAGALGEVAAANEVTAADMKADVHVWRAFGDAGVVQLDVRGEQFVGCVLVGLVLLLASEHGFQAEVYWRQRMHDMTTYGEIYRPCSGHRIGYYSCTHAHAGSSTHPDVLSQYPQNTHCQSYTHLSDTLSLLYTAYDGTNSVPPAPTSDFCGSPLVQATSAIQIDPHTSCRHVVSCQYRSLTRRAYGPTR
jgi:hypothetical protein